MSKVEIMIIEKGTDIHKTPNPGYLQKLKNIEKKDKRIHFKNINDFDKHFEL